MITESTAQHKQHDPAVSVVDRFWAKVCKTGPTPAHCPELGPCWEWMAARNALGYGRFALSRRNWLANRVAWLLTNGPIPDGKLVLHHCDNPPCVNPAHLYLGENADNAADRSARGRSRPPRLCGSENPAAKLTADGVLQIRSRRAAGETAVAIGRDYGISPGTVYAITKRVIWRHL